MSYCFRSLSEIQMIVRVTGFNSKLSKANKSYQLFPKAFEINTFRIPNEHRCKNRCADLFLHAFYALSSLNLFHRLFFQSFFYFPKAKL